MFGKFFASTFTGSMFGAGPDVFAVWGYVIANAVDSTVELNPAMLASVLGMTSDRVRAAIDYLTSPDPDSRNKDDNGRRLQPQGAFQYRVTSHEKYRAIRNEEERRTYNRLAQQRSRANRKKKTKRGQQSVSTVNDSQSKSSMSAHTEAEAEEERSLMFSDQGSGSGSLAAPPQDLPRARESGAARDDVGDRTAARVWNSETLLRKFAAIRAEFVSGALPWVTPKGAGEKAARLADELQRDPGASDDVEATVRLMFQKARSGGRRDAHKVLSEPTFAFGCWCAEFTALREELRGIGAAVQDASDHELPD